MLVSKNSEEKFIRVVKEVISIHKQGYFELKNFISNSTKVAEALEGKSKEANLSKTLLYPDALNEVAGYERILGMT